METATIEKPRPGGRPLTRQLAALAEADATPHVPPTPLRDHPQIYEPSLVDELVMLARMGLSPTEIADHWSVAVETLRAWGDAHPAFEAALARARSASQAWWERQARKAMATRDNKFPAGAWAMVMRARFADYRERVEINHHLDIRALVHVSRDEAEAGLPDERTVGGAKRLKALKAVRLDASHTASGDLQIDALTPGEPSAGDPGNTGPDKA